METRAHWRALVALVRPYRGRVAFMGAVLAVVGLLPLLGPLLIAAFLDRAALGASTFELTSLAAAYLGLGLARTIMAVVVAWVATDLAWRVTNELRTDLTRHVLALDLGFHRATSPGELVSRVDGDVTALSEFVSRFAVKAIAAAVTLVGIIVVLLIRDWRVGLAFAVYLAVAVATVWRLRDRAVDEASSEQAAMGRMYGEVEERLAGADDLRSNGGGSHAIARFQLASALATEAVLLREKQGVGLWVISNAVFVLGGLVALAADAALLRNGSITLGTAYLIFQFTQVLRQPLSQLADETERVQRAAGGMVRTVDLLGQTSSVGDAGTDALPPGPLGLELDRLGFTYDDEDDPQTVIDDLSLDLPAGRTIGVLGRTGSGKTTLARLVLRLVDPTTGRIRLGGVPLGDTPLDELRRRTGVVSQDVHLFGATIRDNLRLFDESIGDEALRDALRELDLLDWVESMPAGLDTELGPEGSGLSAGEGQLIALTRLFLRSPDFVLLDEASSRIDPETEQRVTRAIDRLLDGRTAVVIAHRLATIQRLDEVLILDGGRAVERGSTSELAADPTSRYARLLAVGGTASIDEVVDEVLA